MRANPLVSVRAYDAADQCLYDLGQVCAGEEVDGPLERALGSWDTRIPTGKLNAFLGEIVAAHPHPVRGGKQPRILFATQAQTRPPTIVLFTTGFLEAGYRRFLERKFRETFGFVGSPVRISVRVRERKAKGKR